MLVRLLFAGLIICFLGFQGFRARYDRETYPGLYMPSFRGNGLHMVSPTEGVFNVQKFVVLFEDHTSAEITDSQLFGNIPPPLFEVITTMMAPNANRHPPGFTQTWHRWLSHAFFGSRPPESNELIPSDIRQYLRNRLKWVYPNRKPASLTVTIYDVPFSPSDFSIKPRRVSRQDVIDLHEGA